MIYLPLFWSLNIVTHAAKCILFIVLIFTFSIRVTMLVVTIIAKRINDAFVQTNELLLGLSCTRILPHIKQ